MSCVKIHEDKLHKYDIFRIDKGNNFLVYTTHSSTQDLLKRLSEYYIISNSGIEHIFGKTRKDVDSKINRKYWCIVSNNEIEIRVKSSDIDISVIDEDIKYIFKKSFEKIGDRLRIIETFRNWRLRVDENIDLQLILDYIVDDNMYALNIEIQHELLTLELLQKYFPNASIDQIKSIFLKHMENNFKNTIEFKTGLSLIDIIHIYRRYLGRMQNILDDLKKI